MSREVIADPALAVRPRPADVSEQLAQPVAAAPVTAPIVLPRPGSAGTVLPTRRPSRGRRVLAVVAGAALAVAALGAGVVAGNARADRAATDRLVAGTRVLLWTDAATGSGATLHVALAAAGAPVHVERLRLAIGSATVTGTPGLSAGRRVPADLQLVPDCAGTAAADARGPVIGVPGTGGDLLTGGTAVVRVDGTDRTAQVPLDVVGDPAAFSLAFLARCTPGAAAASDPPATPDAESAQAVAAEGDTPASAALVTVSHLAATRTGDLTFTVRAAADRGVVLGLLVARPADAGLRVTVRGRPALPLRLAAGATRRVTVHVSAACRAPGVLPPTYGLLQLTARATGGRTDPARTTVDGWDDAVAANAVTAAVLTGCPAAAPVSRVSAARA